MAVQAAVDQTFPWTAVELVCDLLDLLVGEKADVAAFWDVLPNKAVEVFVAAARPQSGPCVMDHQEEPDPVIYCSYLNNETSSPST